MGGARDDHAEALAKALEPTQFRCPADAYVFLKGFADEEGNIPRDQLSRIARALAAYRSRPAAEVVTEEMVREIWDHATNATCQTLQDKGMCNCPDGGCVAATVVPEMADLIYHCTLATPPAAGTEPAGEVVDARLCKLRFFRDLIESERVKVYKVFGVLPSDFDERLNHGIESKLFKHLVAALREQSEA